LLQKKGKASPALISKYPAQTGAGLVIAAWRKLRGVVFVEKMLDKELIDILACPACKADVELKGNKIVCKKCGRKYPVREGIPVMLIDEADQA
jgi:hypothetical protein